MDLKTLEAVYDLTSCLLKPFRPFDVVLFVESGPQLHDNGDVSLLFSAASIRYCAKRDFVSSRYSVSLMEMTAGSAAASLTSWRKGSVLS